MTRDRRGFTLVELIIVAVLGTLVVGAALQVLVVNQRTYTAQTATISGQQSTRMALDVLFNELREVSPGGGDIVAMSGDSLRVRLMRKFGIVCHGLDYTSAPDLYVIPFGFGTNAFAAGDSVFVWADNDEDINSDDVWFSASVENPVGTTVCPQDGVTVAQVLKFHSQNAAFTADSVGAGAPIRSYIEFTFGTTTLLGDTYFSRRQGNGDMVPVAGPIRATNGVAFVYRDAYGVVTATPADVRQIEIMVRTGSNVLDGLGGTVADSITAWIYTRN